MTPADHTIREAATRPIVERIEAQRQATAYPVDAGYAGIVEIPVEPVLRITENGVELRQPQEVRS